MAQQWIYRAENDPAFRKRADADKITALPLNKNFPQIRLRFIITLSQESLLIRNIRIGVNRGNWTNVILPALLMPRESVIRLSL
jgi:hypothetical protein